MKYDEEHGRLVVQPLCEELAALPPLPAAAKEMSWGAQMAECESHLRRIEMLVEAQDERLEALAYAIANL
jgi:hypothetical protein